MQCGECYNRGIVYMGARALSPGAGMGQGTWAQGRGSPAGNKAQGETKVRLTWFAWYRDLRGCPKSLGSLWMVTGAPEGFISRGGKAADLWSEWNFKGWHWWCLSLRTIQRQEDQVGADFIPLRRDGGLTSDRRGRIPKTVNCPNHGVQLGPWHFWSFSMEGDPLWRLKTDSPSAASPQQGWAMSVIVGGVLAQDMKTSLWTAKAPSFLLSNSKEVRAQVG